MEVKGRVVRERRRREKRGLKRGEEEGRGEEVRRGRRLLRGAWVDLNCVRVFMLKSFFKCRLELILRGGLHYSEE